eukprot:CAMPEP_0168619506 /NCGR_PEP_ID=MMETSP0449_2-20121227/6637_1 /TAXON_ID=1082188 /ORGANISM="Strombidium rassoulzadegani, Strain ras09" /LENGTH=45 /DNA_ID= /DNA_START= /DNA_END= /DNA_ORIENTATION=
MSAKPGVLIDNEQEESKEQKKKKYPNLLEVSGDSGQQMTYQPFKG